MISAMVATAMSVIIRLELSGPGDQFLHENRQVYNVLVTGHAIAMIFHHGWINEVKLIT